MTEQLTEFQEKPSAVANTMVNAVVGDQDAIVLLEAALLIHRFVVAQLPANLQQIAVAAAAAYVDEQQNKQATAAATTKPH